MEETRSNAPPLDGAWSTLAFTLQSASGTTGGTGSSSTSAVQVTSLSLTAAPTATTWVATNNANLSGSVGVPASAGSSGVSLGGTQVQFDTTGDGQPDATVTAAANGSFSYSPQNLTDGPVTIEARTATPGASGLVYGNWMSISFVFYSTVLTQAEAQSMAAAYAASDSGTQSAQNAYTQTTSSAQVTDQGTQDADEETYLTSVGTAGASCETNNATAQSAYQAQIAQDQSAYQAALAQAASNFQANLAADGGNTTSYNLADFTWPDAPPSSSWTLPADSSQPQPDVRAGLHGHGVRFLGRSALYGGGGRCGGAV